MCIVTKKKGVTEKDKLIYKVLVKLDDGYFFPYRTHYGEKEGINKFSSYKEINEGLFEAFHFDAGYGFHAFATTKMANAYIKCMKKKHTFEHKQKLVIVKFFVPEGTKIRKGVVKKGYVGSGLSAIAVEKMVFYKEMKIRK
jgi:hypothetical protein